jgi:hypothetical protein
MNIPGRAEGEEKLNVRADEPRLLLGGDAATGTGAAGIWASSFRRISTAWRITRRWPAHATLGVGGRVRRNEVVCKQTRDEKRFLPSSVMPIASSSSAVRNCSSKGRAKPLCANWAAY